MSNFSTIYDEIFTTIEATFTGNDTKTQLTNPYVTIDNNEMFLKNGYGVEILSMNETDAFNRELRQFERQVAISFTKRVISTDKQTSNRLVQEKAMVSDQLDLLRALKNNVSADHMEFVSDDGIESIFDEREDYIRLRSIFIINYNETVR